MGAGAGHEPLPQRPQPVELVAVAGTAALALRFAFLLAAGITLAG